MKLETEYFDMDQITASTPKLSLYSLPSKPLTPPGSLTPPLHTVAASIPFQWEEAPGKPRPVIISTPTTTTLPPAPYSSNNNKSKAARCLDLPPRLTLTDHQQISSKITSVPSPTTVFEGPDQHEDDDQGFTSLSHTMSFCYGDQEEKVGACGRSRVMRPSRGNSFSFSSWRWGSFRDNSNRKASVGSSFDFSSSIHGGGGGFEDESKKVKIARVRRRSSFLSFSNNSNLVASMYGSFKQALPWRRRS